MVYTHLGRILWPDGELQHCSEEDDLGSILQDRGYSLADIKYDNRHDPVEGGGPSGPSHTVPSEEAVFLHQQATSILPTVELVNDNENSQHFFTHLWTILGATEHALKCTDYVAGDASKHLKLAFVAVSSILHKMGITPIAPLTETFSDLVNVVKDHILSHPPEQADVSMDDAPPR